MHRVENKEGGNPALTRTIAAWPRYPLTSNAVDSSGGASSGGDTGGASPSSGGDASPSDVCGASPSADRGPSHGGGRGPSALLRG